MDICFLIDDMNTGGAQRVVSLLADAFCKQGHSVRIVVQRPTAMLAYTLNPQVRTVFLAEEEKRLHIFRFPGNFRKLMMKVKSRFSPSRADIYENINFFAERSKVVAAYFKVNPTNVIFSFLVESNILIGLAAGNIHAKIFVAERNYPDRPMEPHIKVLRDKAYAKCTGCVFQTVEQAALFSKKIQRKAIVIPNPVKSDLPEAFAGERRKAIVNYCGFKAHKNIPLLIGAYAKIFSKHPEYTLELYGYGNDAQIKQMIEKLHLEDQILISPFCADIHEKVRDAAMFVMTSDYEGMPNALLEAMAIGLPVISTDCRGGGAKAMIQNRQNGILVPVGDEEAVVEAINFYIENPDDAEEYGKNAQEIRKNFDIAEICRRWLNLIPK